MGGLEYHASNINNYNRRLDDLTRLTEDDELWASPFIDFNFKEVQRLVDCVHFEVEDLLQFRDARVDPSLWSERAYEKYLSVGKEISSGLEKRLGELRGIKEVDVEPTLLLISSHSFRGHKFDNNPYIFPGYYPSGSI